MSDDTLALALALHRAPIQRFALRDRPLPADIGSLIHLASAVQPLLSDTAARLGVRESTLLEAVRFYLQQVLFEPGTDAYRVLGVRSNTPSELIRAHYRWLQRWLHPDRRGDDWEALLTTRVNWAWQQLRNDTARRAYDARIAAPTQSEMPTSTQIRSGEWRAVQTASPRGSWFKRLALGLSLGSCLGLFYLALTRHDPIPLHGLAAQQVMRPAAIHARIPFDTPSVLHAAPVVFTENETKSAPPRTLPAAPPPAVSTPNSEPSRPVTSSRAIVVVADAYRARVSAAVALPPTAPIPDNLTARRSMLTADTTAAQRERVAGPSLARPGDADRPSPKLRDERSANMRLPVESMPSLHPQSARNASPEATHAVAAASAYAPRATSNDPPVDRLQRSVPLASVATPVVAAPAYLSPAETATIDPAAMGQRIEMARQRVRDIVDYFRRSDTMLLDWADADGQLAMQRERSDLRERNGIEGAGRFALESPMWRASGDAVALDATYHVREAGDRPESGRFSVAMVWRGETWHVVRVKLERSQ